MKDSRTKFLKSRRFRYGALATALTAVFVALVVLLNIVFTALCQHYLWYADMTDDQVFTLAESTKDYLGDLDDQIFIYFCNDEDKVRENVHLMYVYTTAKLIEEANRRIKVECHNVRVEKAFFEPFLTTAGSSIDQTSVVLYNATSGESRIYSYQTFFVMNDSDTIWAYNGEYKFVSGILQITGTEQPIAYFTIGHGEDVTEGMAPTQDGDGNTRYPGALPLSVLLGDAGFEVRTIDLSREEIDDAARMIVIFDPAYDFLGNEAEDASYNEIAKLGDFLTIGDNALLVFGSPDHSAAFLRKPDGTPKANLAEFLDEWGIAYEEGTRIRDYAHARSVDGLTIQPQYGASALGSSLYAELTNLSSMPMTAIRASMALNLTRGTEFKKNNYDMCQVSPILTSYDSSQKLLGDTVAESGAFSLAMLSRARRIVSGDNGNNGDYIARYRYSYVVAFGSPSFASSSYLYSNVYANRDILFATMKAVGRDTVLASIDFKVLDDHTLTVTTAQAHAWTAAMTLVLPAVVAVTGAVVCIRRKHS